MSETKYVFDLITDKAVSHLNNNDGIYVDDWFHTDGVRYDILNGVKELTANSLIESASEFYSISNKFLV